MSKTAQAEKFTISTVEDALNAVIETENIDGFVADFRAWLEHSMALKQSIESIPGFNQMAFVAMQEYVWINDDKPGELDSINIKIEKQKS